VSLKYALIGDPVAHSLSPAMHNAAFGALGIDAEYEAMRVDPTGLGPVMERLRSGFAGFNVTTPLKEVVLPFLDHMTDEARTVMAANTVRVESGRMTGHNTDGSGFVSAIADVWRLSPAGALVCVLGSGPAARAIAAALKRAGAKSVACWSRNAATAARIGPFPGARPEVLVSALPPDAVIPADVLDAIAGARYVFDVNYGVRESPIPTGIGTQRSDGLPLLLHQGALAFEWWTGRKAPIDVMRDALKAWNGRH
jgi:shikimate dehydrogenase